MKMQTNSNPALDQKSHEMLMRLLKVAELLNKGNRAQQHHSGCADQKPSAPIFIEKECKKP